MCDASKSGLGAVLEQKQQQVWTPIAFASHFLNAAEMRYSTNELESCDRMNILKNIYSADSLQFVQIIAHC